MSRSTTCPHCSTRLRVSEQVTDKTLICPHCLADVDNPQSTFQIQAADIDTDVKRGLSLGSIILAVLIGLCVLGIIMAFLALRTGKGDFGAGISLLFCFALLDALVGIAIVRGLIHWGISGVRSPSVGRVIGIVFLSLGTMVAAVIFFFFTCVFLMIQS
jgi:hypothetical protein